MLFDIWADIVYYLLQIYFIIEFELAGILFAGKIELPKLQRIWIIDWEFDLICSRRNLLIWFICVFADFGELFEPICCFAVLNWAIWFGDLVFVLLSSPDLLSSSSSGSELIAVRQFVFAAVCWIAAELYADEFASNLVLYSWYFDIIRYKLLLIYLFIYLLIIVIIRIIDICKIIDIWRRRY